ncbi:MAG: transposase zinc-binding domain-containing protein, partial [Clostridium sp.]|nr:transposase zinc-binding domain-containing protein [Clostridium sp.]MBS4008361.1 transposase zinc-binding domain-containing protein [Clostridium sp.]
MKGIIRKIFSDHWQGFVETIGRSKVRPTIIREVERMLSCGSFNNGYTEYRCNCGEKK